MKAKDKPAFFAMMILTSERNKTTRCQRNTLFLEGKVMEQTNWIWTDEWNAEDDRNPRLVYFRREVELEKPPETAVPVFLSLSLSLHSPRIPHASGIASLIPGRTCAVKSFPDAFCSSHAACFRWGCRFRP